MNQAAHEPLLEALPEPTMLLRQNGEISFANRAMRKLLGEDPSGSSLRDLVLNAPELASYLGRCSGSGAPVIGAVSLSREGQPRKLQARGSAVLYGNARHILLQLSDADQHRFAALTRTIAELKKELARRKRSEALLAETARDRELLLRELEHRVKNNMQMLSALLSGAAREAATPEAKEALADASLRFAAVSAVQRLLYRSDELGTIPARDLVTALCNAAASLATGELRTDIELEDVELSLDSSVSVGLILNELITNALKYGRPGTGIQTLSIRLVREGEKLVFTVADNGPGFDEAESGKRASGLGLVRGLLRQLGGAIEVDCTNGTCWTVTLPVASVAAKGAS